MIKETYTPEELTELILEATKVGIKPYDPITVEDLAKAIENAKKAKLN